MCRYCPPIHFKSSYSWPFSISLLITQPIISYFFVLFYQLVDFFYKCFDTSELTITHNIFNSFNINRSIPSPSSFQYIFPHINHLKLAFTKYTSSELIPYSLEIFSCESYDFTISVTSI